MSSEGAPGRDFSFFLALNMNMTPEAVWAFMQTKLQAWGRKQVYEDGWKIKVEIIWILEQSCWTNASKHLTSDSSLWKRKNHPLFNLLLIRFFCLCLPQKHFYQIQHVIQRFYVYACGELTSMLVLCPISSNNEPLTLQCCTKLNT